MSESQENKNEKISERDAEIRRVVEERRNIVKREKHKLKDFSKRIKKCIREKKSETSRKDTADSRRIQRHQKYIMHKFWKRTLTLEVKNDKGDTIISRKRIANVFGDFYSKLFAATQLGEEAQEPRNMETETNKEKNSSSEDVKNEIQEFTQIEVQAAMGKPNKK